MNRQLYKAISVINSDQNNVITLICFDALQGGEPFEECMHIIRDL